MSGQESDTQERRRLSTTALRLLAFVILVMLAAAVSVAQQRGSGAYVADVAAGDAGEARHFVTALMVRDLAAAGLPPAGTPAADYALRLPPALPPGEVTLFHVAEAAWLGLLPPTVPAALLLPALAAALLAVTAGWAAARVCGPLPGVAVGFVVCAATPVRAASLEVTPALFLAVAALLAALAFARYARRPGGANAALLAGAGLIAILTAPGGALVLLVPPLAALLCGRPRLLRDAGLPAVLALWAAIAAGMALRSGARPDPAGWESIAAVFAELAAGFGTLPLALAGAGILFTLGAGLRRDADGHADRDALAMAPMTALAGATLAAMLLGGLGSAGAVVLTAPTLMLAAFGAMRLIGLLTSGWTIIAGLAVALALLLGAMPALLEPVRKGAIGMDAAAEAFLARGDAARVAVVVADPAGAAAFAAAVAQRDRAGRTYVVDAARLRAADPGALLALFDEIGASALVVAPGTGESARALPAAFPDRFRPAGTFPRADGRGEVALYAIGQPSDAPARDPAPALRRLAAPGA